MVALEEASFCTRSSVAYRRMLMSMAVLATTLSLPTPSMRTQIRCRRPCSELLRSSSHICSDGD
jgi:hypothetical protein